jgi:hypothetical protein
MHGAVAGTVVYQASFEELDRALELLGWSIGGFLVAFLLYALVLGLGRGTRTPILAAFVVGGGLVLIVLGLTAIVLALALLATALYLALIACVLGCLGFAALLLWRYFR